MEGFNGVAGSGSGRPDPFPTPGSVACGGLWVMTAVDSSSSAVIYVRNPYIGGGLPGVGRDIHTSDR